MSESTLDAVLCTPLRPHVPLLQLPTKPHWFPRSHRTQTRCLDYSCPHLPIMQMSFSDS